MSRLIVKNLPAHLDDARLKSHFSSQGHVTDVKLIRRQDGVSRRFGFVGYSSESDARAAMEYFNRTFIDTSRIVVDLAKKIDDPALEEEANKRKRKSGLVSIEAAPVPPSGPGRPPLNASTTTDTDAALLPPPNKKAKLSSARPTPQEEEKTLDALMESSRIFVRNLPFSTSAEDIERVFGRHGEVSQVHIPLDKETKLPKGVAFVTFADPAHAVAAYRALDGSTFQGRLLHLIAAVEKHGSSALPARDGNTSGTAASQGKDAKKQDTLKQGKLKERRAMAGKDFNWSTLYMNPDAVAASVADRLGISKSDILNPDADAADKGGASGSSAAVRLALAETRVIQETKEFLTAHGISLDAFDERREESGSPTKAAGTRPKSIERSETTMLVKNIPYGTSADEIRALFARHGEVAQVLLPPAGTLAIVQMLIPGEARVAFRALAYRRFKDSVLYLEKAPQDLFVGAAVGDVDAASGRKGKEAPASRAALKLGGGAAEGSSKATTDEGGQAVDASSGTGDGSAAAPPGATLFVKNLNFSSTDAGLTAAFAAFPDFAFARVQTKPAPAPAPTSSSRSSKTDGVSSSSSSARPDGRLSMGYGFAVFKSAEAAQRAQKGMDGFLLDGHALNVKFAKRGHDADDDAAAGAKGTSSKAPSTTATKLMIKNLPFETTKRDVRELFAAHGQVRSVRLPKRIDNRPRGFAFVEFVSHREAEAAKEALKHTRLLGRHLVFGWAENESAATTAGLDVGGVERQRAKEALVHGEADASLRGKKGKIRMNAEDIADAVAAEKRKRAAAAGANGDEESDDDDDDDEEGGGFGFIGA